MSWKDPLRHLSPLSEHPSVAPLLSPAISDDEVSIRLDRFGDTSDAGSRILRAFFDNLDQDCKKVLAADIGNCQDDDQKLLGLANHLLDAILKPFQLAGGQAPPLLTPPSDDAGQAIDEASTRADQTNLRNDCLRRDGYRWSFDEKDAVQTRNEAIIWFALYRYFPALGGKIDARSINQRANAMILSKGVNGFFKIYMLAFIPQGSNNYRATQFFEGPIESKSKSGSPLVPFTSTDDTIPMPDDDFLRTHYIISQILDVSGFGDQISMAAETAYLDLDCHALHPSGCTDVGAMLSRMLLLSVRADAEDSTGQNHGAEKTGMRKEEL